MGRGSGHLIRAALIGRRADDFSSAQFKPLNKRLISEVMTTVNHYLGCETYETFQSFRRRDGNLGIELVSGGRDRGYVLVGPLQVERDFEKRLEKSLEYYKGLNVTLLRKFIDYQNELAGFSWKRR